MEKSPENRVVVTDIGYTGPLALTAKELWPQLLAGRSGITAAPAELNLPVKVIALAQGFDPLNYMDKKAADRTDRFVQFIVAAHSQLSKEHSLERIIAEDPYSHGVIIGTGMGGFKTILEEYDKFKEKDRVSAFMIPKIMPNAPNSHVSQIDGRKGPGATTVSACASGADAIVAAYMAIIQGDADTMIAGGTEAIIIPVVVTGFYLIKALSRYEGGTPGTSSRPFDAERDGFVMGEGAAVLGLRG